MMSAFILNSFRKKNVIFYPDSELLLWFRKELKEEFPSSQYCYLAADVAKVFFTLIKNKNLYYSNNPLVIKINSFSVYKSIHFSQVPTYLYTQFSFVEPASPQARLLPSFVWPDSKLFLKLGITQTGDTIYFPPWVTSTSPILHLYDESYNKRPSLDKKHYLLSPLLYSILWKELAIANIVLYTHQELFDLIVGLALSKNYCSEPEHIDQFLYRFQNTPLSSLSEFEHLTSRELEMVLRNHLIDPLTSAHVPVEE